MDYFGRVVEELSDLWDEVNESRHSADAQEFLKALDKAMAAAAKAERLTKAHDALGDMARSA